MAEFTKEIAQKLKAGGEEGISAFLAVAKIARDESGIKGVTEWIKLAFFVLPKKDRDTAGYESLVPHNATAGASAPRSA